MDTSKVIQAKKKQQKLFTKREATPPGEIKKRRIKIQMTKNTLNDLNNHLFAELERLGDEDLPEDKLDKEIQRSNAISKVATNIIQNANVSLKGYSMYQEYLDDKGMPKMIGVKNNEKNTLDKGTRKLR